MHSRPPILWKPQDPPFETNFLLASMYTHEEAVIGRVLESARERCHSKRSGDSQFTYRKAAQSFGQGDLICHRELSTGFPPVRTFKTYRCRSAHVLGYGLLAMLLCFWITPATAAFINFQNCLSQAYQDTNPPALQFVPLFMDASFNTTDPSHQLMVTVWGNVTGAYSSTEFPLPPPNSRNWTDPNYTNGKIENLPYPRTRWTTLSRKANVLTYEPWKESDRFCEVLVNGTCPLAPSFTANAYVFCKTLLMPSFVMLWLASRILYADYFPSGASRTTSHPSTLPTTSTRATLSHP
jgi:hypothetical protein